MAITLLEIEGGSEWVNGWVIKFNSLFGDSKHRDPRNWKKIKWTIYHSWIVKGRKIVSEMCPQSFHGIKRKFNKGDTKINSNSVTSIHFRMWALITHGGLIHWGWHKTDAISQMTFSYIFLNENVRIFIKISPNLFPKVQLTISQLSLR